MKMTLAEWRTERRANAERQLSLAAHRPGRPTHAPRTDEDLAAMVHMVRAMWLRRFAEGTWRDAGPARVELQPQGLPRPRGDALPK
jgi:hypothetical protein